MPRPLAAKRRCASVLALFFLATPSAHADNGSSAVDENPPLLTALADSAGAPSDRTGASSEVADPASVGKNETRASQPAPQAVELLGKTPLHFEPNRGQTDARVKFLARGPGYTLFLTPGEAVLNLLSGRQPDSAAREQAAVRMQLVGANSKAHLEGLEPLSGKSNYFLGNDSKKWRTNVPHYAKVRQQGVYPGIDLVYYGNPRQLEYDFVLSPGADPEKIRLEFHTSNSPSGAAPRIKDGDLVLETAAGEVRFKKPIVYQEIEGKRREIAGEYKFLPPAGDGETGVQLVGFQLAAYDAERPLVIDPTLTYSTYLGGSAQDIAWAIAVGSDGSAYVTGQTTSPDFPTLTPLPTGATPPGLVDVFVTKLNAAGTALVYSTYLGGGADDIARGIAVDSGGNAYVVGETGSSNFPLSSSPLAYQQTKSGGRDAFFTKLSSNGSALLYSTYLGGSNPLGGGDDVAYGVAVGAAGLAYLTGDAGSSTFPITSGTAFQGTHGGGGSDAFVAVIDPTLGPSQALFYSTFLGGSQSDIGAAIAVDGFGNAYVTGQTLSTNFPTKVPYDQLCGSDNTGVCVGGNDAFVAKINTLASGNASLVFSTYLGGNGNDLGWDIKVDGTGNVYLAGETNSPDFPTTTGAYDTSCGTDGTCNSGSYDAFVTKIAAAGSTLIYSTFLGGSSEDYAFALALDSGGNAYVTGGTRSTDFPIAGAPTPQASKEGFLIDVFVARLNAVGTALVYSTYLGGTNSDYGYAIAVDGSCNAYVTGATESVSNPGLGAIGFPTAGSPVYPTCGGSCVGGDAFVAKISNPETSCNGGGSDTTPDPFTFTPQTGVALSTPITSNVITVSGITAAASISVTGGEYNINGGAFTSAAGTVNNGYTVQVRHTSAATNSTTVNTILTIGGVSGTFSSTTLAGGGSDTTPDPFTFTPLTGVAPSTVIASNVITVSGINAAAPISVTGGEYSVNSSAFTSAAGTVNNGYTVQVRHTSAATNSTSVNTTLTIGGVSNTFTSTTVAGGGPDTTPDTFAFTDQTGVALSTQITSAPVLITGINASTSWTASGGTACAGTNTSNCGCADGSFAASGTITNSQYICARHTSSATNSTAVNTTVTIGGVSDTFSSTTVGGGGATFQVNAVKNGLGLIRSGDDKIICGPTCAANYSSGTMAALTALPEVGYTFANWTAGPCSGANTNPCNTGAITAATTVTALFNDAGADPGTGMRVTATANGLPATPATDDASVSNPVTVRYTLRSCTELFVIVSGPGIPYSYLNASGTLVPLTTLPGITPYRGSGPGDGLYTLVANYAAASGNYDLYFACDNTLNNSLDITPANMVFDYIRVIVP